MRVHKGDLTQMGSWSFAYDAQGNLLRARNSDTNVNVNASYFRDASGHRAVKQVNGTQTFFFNLGSLQLEKYDVSSGVASSTIYEPGTDRPLAEVAANGSVTYYHQDVLGNVVLLTSATGAVVEIYSYDAWGKVSVKDGTGAVVTTTPKARFLYTAREYDPESGLYDYRARAYSPELGRFLQMDPIDFAGGDVNIFMYVGNDPLDWTDPSGLQRMPGMNNSAYRGLPNGPLARLPREQAEGDGPDFEQGSERNGSLAQAIESIFNYIIVGFYPPSTDKEINDRMIEVIKELKKQHNPTPSLGAE